MENQLSHKSQGTTPQIRVGLINEIFAMMALRYPTSKWLTDGDVSLHKRLWAEDLKDFSNERVRKALGMVRDTHPSFPPTIGEFRQLIASTPRPLAIEASPICSNCRSSRISAIHAEMCGGSKE